ncbi:MAG: in [Acidobacteriota bacterium]|jgi:subtilisin family serine protease|nr:in [Acidobacteriota bacterium]
MLEGRSRLSARLGLCVTALLVLGGAFPGAPASAVTAAPAIRIDPTTLYFGAATPPAVSASAAAAVQAPGFQPRPEVPAALRQKASRPEGVRVLVRLATPFVPEGGLSGVQQRQDQRQAIVRAQAAMLTALAGAHARAKVTAHYKFIPFLALQVDAAALDALAGLPQFAGVQEDVLERPSLASSTAVIGAGVAWSHGLTGSGQTIAILDTGVDKTHPFFASGDHNKVVSEACYSSTLNGTISLCPGGAEEATGPGTGVNCDVSMSSSCRHGTHVAGIAAGNDGTHFGVARDADLIAIQVFSADCGGFCIGAWTSDVVKGFERVYELSDQFKIAAVNVSLGGWLYSSRESCDADNPAEKAAIDNLRSVDIATVAAAGNNFSLGVSAPACISSAVGVGATDDNDVVANFSNIDTFLDLMAPGVDVESSVPGGGTASFDGTSMSTPHVAGAWAVLRQQNPSATVSDLLALLRGTAVQVGGFGFDLRRINLGKAVTTGLPVSQGFVIHNDGSAVLSILGMQLETPVSWIHWTPEAPFDVPAGGSRQVSVSVDFSTAPAGTTLDRLIVSSNDGSKNPYPDAVHLVIGKAACYPLTRARTGNGGFPDPTPASSPGCPAGEHYAGEVIQLQSTPAIGWALQSWSGTDDDASTAATNTLTMPAAPHTVSATYYAPCFALTLTHTGSGANPVASPASSPSCPAGQYKYGEPLQLTASPAAGWRVGSWTGTAHDASRGLTNTVAMPGSALTVAANYLEGIPTALLVDDSFYTYSRPFFTAALDALGRVYDVWDVAEDGSPDASTLAAYPKVIWIPESSSGPSPSEETALATYLDGGGTFFIAAPEYVWGQGFTSFMSNYLGVGTVSQDWYFYDVTGQGSAFGGLGLYNLSYSYYDDLLYPGPGAETAFSATVFSTSESAGVSKVGPNYRTIFLGFPFESLPTPEARRDVMGSALDYLGTVFADVPPKYWARRWIEAIYRAGITSGCGSNPRRYCPEDVVTRGSMAQMLLAAKEGPGYVPPACSTSPFSDVPTSSPLCPWIQELVHRGVTSGCGGGQYCPGNPVTRSQMAVFLLSTWHGPGYVPPPCTTAAFNDVPSTSPFCPWIQEMVSRGITAGCGGGGFCTENPNTRAQLAVFLSTTFGIPVQ